MELHPINCTAEIDTDAAFSCSTRMGDFICLNTSPGAISAIPPPTGAGGAQSMGGIGALVCRCKSGRLVIDPDGIFIKTGPRDPQLCVFSAPRLKALGLKVEQCMGDMDEDVLIARATKERITLAESSGILVMDTVGDMSNVPDTPAVRRMLKEIRTGKRSAMVIMNDVQEKGCWQDSFIQRNHVACQRWYCQFL